MRRYEYYFPQIEVLYNQSDFRNTSNTHKYNTYFFQQDYNKKILKIRHKKNKKIQFSYLSKSMECANNFPFALEADEIPFGREK